MWLPIFLAYQVTGRLDGVTRCMQYFDSAVTQPEYLSILGEMNRKLGFRARPVNDRSTGGFRQVQVPAYKVGVKMGFENILDSGLPLFRQLKIGIDIPQGVDDSCFSFTLDVVSCFTQASGV